MRGWAVLAISALVVGAGLGTWQAWPGGNRQGVAEAMRTRPVVRPPQRVARPPQLLLVLRRPLPRGPKVTAGSAILVDASTGTVLFARRPHRRRPIASTTKIMTAVVALSRLGPNEIVTIAPSVPRVAPFREGLRAGERVQAWKLFYGLLLYSGNDDALALAIGAAGSRPAFVALMNAKARELGLHDTHFRSPSGLIDRDNYSSAWDLAALTRYALWNPRFAAVVRTRVKRVPWPAPTYAKVYVNKNHLIGKYPGADGVKTGWTTVASHCLVASAHRHGIRLIAVVLHSSDPYGDAKRLLDFGFGIRG